MNLLYTLPWHNPGAEENARHLYDQLRTATVQGTRFPFDCPYEVALASQRAADGAWLVAVLAMRGIILDDAQRTETIVKLEDWFARSGAAGMRGGQTEPADHLKVASELGLDYVVVESFGTFVGEPTPGDEEKKPEPEPVKPTATAVISPERPPETLSEALGRAAATRAAAIGAPATTPPPASPAVTVRPATAISCITWAGAIMIAGGGFLGVVGLLLALIMALGQFASESPETTLSDFFLVMACFPLPILVFAAAMVGIGIFMVFQARKKRAGVVQTV